MDTPPEAASIDVTILHKRGVIFNCCRVKTLFWPSFGSRFERYFSCVAKKLPQQYFYLVSGRLMFPPQQLLDVSCYAAVLQRTNFRCTMLIDFLHVPSFEINFSRQIPSSLENLNRASSDDSTKKTEDFIPELVVHANVRSHQGANPVCTDSSYS